MSLRTALVVALLAGGVAPGTARAQDRVAFERDVLPVLRTRCFDCHQAPRRAANGRLVNPKGGLRLDGRAWIERGGEGGPVLAPGTPDDSELWLRTALPADDPDVMPAKGDPLAPDQVALLRRWIAEGADFGTWQGAADTTVAPDVPARPPAPAAARLQRLAALADGLPEPPAAAIDRAAAAGAHVRSVLGDDRRLLRVGFPGREARIDDAALSVLAPLRPHVAELGLARTRISDAALAEVARLPNLTRLDLARTAVGDAGIRRLGAPAHLQSLNLFATRVTDASIETLAALPALEVVHVWQSGITDAGIAALRRARPQLRVVGAPDLPEPEAETERPRPRRR